MEKKQSKVVIMLFKPELIKLILKKKKTQTRRPSKDNESIDYIMVQKRHGNVVQKRLATQHHNKKGDLVLKTKYRIGKTYALQPGRGKPSIGRRILIKDIFKQKLLEISPSQAEKEGFESIDGFLRYFYKINQILFPDAPNFIHLSLPNPNVWVIKFELAPKEGK